MNVLLKILLIAFAFTLTSSHEMEAQPVLPMQITGNGHIVLKAEINGVEGNFIFDTGAGLTVITKDFASQIDGLTKLDGGYTAFRATGERLNIDLYEGNTIQMGNNTLEQSALSIIDMDWPVDGILSLMSFRNQPFTIDFENKKFYLESPETLAKRKEQGTVIPIQLEDSRGKALDVFTYIEVSDSLRLQTSLDSGAGHGVFRIRAEYMPALGVDSTKVKKSYKQSSFNPDEGNIFYHTRLGKMTLYDAPQIGIENIDITFVRGLIYDAIVPIDWLGEKIAFDLAEEEMIIQ